MKPGISNNNEEHFSFNVDERFLPIYQFSAEDNRKIGRLDEFADKFLAKSYRLQFEAVKALRKPKNPVMPSDGAAWRQFTSPLVEMDWSAYLSAVRSSRYHELDKRLSLLRTCQRLFASAGSFGELSPNEWKAIAGVIGEAQKRDSGLDDHDWGWFGSMRGMGDFANRIAEQDG